MTTVEALAELLHPADDRDIPVPGFPSHDALVAWAKTQPLSEVVDGAIEVLTSEPWPQAYAAMGLLRALGVEVWGERGDDDEIRWHVP